MSPTNISLTSFKQRRDDLASAIATLKDLVVHQLDGQNVQQLDSLAQKVRDDLQFIVLCVGDFSSGKTTFINKFLLHDDILPARARPTTTRLTTIRHGASLRATLLKKDGGSEIIADNVKQRIEDAVAAGGSDIDKVDQVLIEVPSTNLAEGLVIVDAPGLNDPDTLRMKVTLDFLHQADAILYFMNAQQAYTRSNKEFLEETTLAREDLDKLFLLLNYWDLIEQPERDDLLSYVNGEVDASLNRLCKKLESEAEVSRPDLIPVSAKTGENQELVQIKIWDYLASKKGQDVLSYSVQRFNTYIDQYVAALTERVKFLDENTKAREVHRRQLADEIEKYRKAKDDFINKLRGYLRPELDNYREQVSTIFDQNINLITNEIQHIQFERNDADMLSRRLAGKLSYFQRRLASELRQAEIKLFITMQARIEEQKSILQVPLKQRQDWQDYISDWNKNPLSVSQEDITSWQKISAFSAISGAGSAIGAGIIYAATKGGLLSRLFIWIKGSTSLPIVFSLGGLAVAAVGVSAYLALQNYSTQSSESKLNIFLDDLTKKLEITKLELISSIDIDREMRLNVICENVNNDIISLYEQKCTEMDNLMSQAEKQPNYDALKSSLQALKLPVNI